LQAHIFWIIHYSNNNNIVIVQLNENNENWKYGFLATTLQQTVPRLQKPSSSYTSNSLDSLRIFFSQCVWRWKTFCKLAALQSESGNELLCIIISYRLCSRTTCHSDNIKMVFHPCVLLSSDHGQKNFRC